MGSTSQDRIVVDVIEVAFKVELVSDDVFLCASLPDVAFTMLASRFGNRQVGDRRRFQRFGELHLHPANPFRVFVVAGRKGPEKVHVVRQDDRRNNLERHFLQHRRHGRAEALHVGCVIKQATTLYITIVKKYVPPGTYQRR